MDEINDGGTAFPVNTENAGHEGACYPSYGMTLRDYFAAKALPGLLELENTGVWNQSLETVPSRRDHALQVAKAAYYMADAMLKARQS